MSTLSVIALCLGFGVLVQSIGLSLIHLEIRRLRDALSITVSLNIAETNGVSDQTNTEPSRIAADTSRVACAMEPLGENDMVFRPLDGGPPRILRGPRSPKADGTGRG